MSDHQATVVYPGVIKGRATIELRILPDGSNEAFLVPSGGSPVPTGVSLEEHKGKYKIKCRIRGTSLAFKPEPVPRRVKEPPARLPPARPRAPRPLRTGC